MVGTIRAINPGDVRFAFIRCPIHRFTFRVRQIRQWVEQECEGKVLNLFAGYTLLQADEIRNDLDQASPAAHHLDAIDFVKAWRHKQKFNTIILDPPYSYRKSMELYGGRQASRFARLKDALPGILAPKGKIITFGYHANVMGRTRGFAIEAIALFSHGGATHDTIASVERLTGDVDIR